MKNKRQYLFILPLVIVLLAVVAYPFFANIGYSFMDYKLIKLDKTFVFLDNYKKIFVSEDFLGLMKKTIIWSVTNIIFTLILGVSVGLLLDSKIKGKFILQSIILIPWVLPETVTAYTWKWMMTSDYGILNEVLMNLQIIGTDFSWFREGSMAMLAVIIANTWRSFPFLAVMVYSKKKGMSESIIEAAWIDGANSFQMCRYITLPHLGPIIKRVSLLIFIWSYNAFGIIYVMTNGGPLGATTTLPIYIQKKAFENFDFGITSAMSINMMLFMLIVLIGTDKLPKWFKFVQEKKV